MRIRGWVCVAGGLLGLYWLTSTRKRHQAPPVEGGGLAPRPTSLRALEGCLVRIEELRRRRGGGAAA